MTEPTNADRAEWARQALEAFPAKEAGQTVQNIKDLITDLGPLLIRCGCDFDQATGTMFAAMDMFEDEVGEENYDQFWEMMEEGGKMEISIRQHGKWVVDFLLDGEPYRLNRHGVVCKRGSDGIWQHAIMAKGLETLGQCEDVATAVIQKIGAKVVWNGRKRHYCFKAGQ